MIRQIDDILLEKLKKSLSIPGDEIVLGYRPDKKRSISILCNDFTVDEAGVGGSATVKYEEVIDTLDTDGSAFVFKLSRPPAKSILSVECPPGSPKAEGDDYVVDPSRVAIRMRAVPKKSKDGIRIKYNIPRAIGETQNVRFSLTYGITIKDADLREREDIALEIIQMFYKDKHMLKNFGIEDIQVVKGYHGNGKDELQSDTLTLIYRVQTTLGIDTTTVGPLEKIALDGIRVK